MRIRLKALAVAFSLMFAATAIAAPPTSRDATIHKYTRIAERDLSGMEIVTMADTQTIWQSAGSGDFDVAANWSNGVPGSVANLLGICNGTSQVSLSINLNQIGASNTFKFRTTPDYFGNIGGPGNALKILAVVDSMAIQLRGRGKHYIGATNLPGIYIDVGTGFVELEGSDDLTKILGVTLVKSGEVVVDGRLELRSPFIVAGGHVTMEKVLDSQKGPSILVVNSGTLVCERGVDKDDYTTDMVVLVNGGTFRMTGTNDDVPVIITGGTMQFVPLAAVPAGGFDLFVLGGLFDATESGQVITIGNLVTYSADAVLGSINTGVSSSAVEYDLSQDWQK